MILQTLHSGIAWCTFLDLFSYIFCQFFILLEVIAYFYKVFAGKTTTPCHEHEGMCEDEFESTAGWRDGFICRRHCNRDWSTR